MAHIPISGPASPWRTRRTMHLSTREKKRNVTQPPIEIAFLQEEIDAHAIQFRLLDRHTAGHFSQEVEQFTLDQPAPKEFPWAFYYPTGMEDFGGSTHFSHRRSASRKRTIASVHI